MFPSKGWKEIQLTNYNNTLTATGFIKGLMVISEPIIGKPELCI